MKHKLFLSRVLNVGLKRIKINPSKEFKLSEISTRLNVRKFIESNDIIILKLKGVSRKTERVLKYNKKTKRLHKVRFLRRLLKENKQKLENDIYREFYLKIKSGVITNKKRLLKLINEK